MVLLYKHFRNNIIICVIINNYGFSYDLVQERLTKQIALAVTQAIQPAGVAVVIEGV